MEQGWVRHIRTIMNRQKETIVDAKIDHTHHLLLKSRVGSHVDLGPIKVRPPGTVAFIANTVEEIEPDVFVTKDGVMWFGATSQGRFAYGAIPSLRAACWTGDRFMIPINQSVDYFSNMLQSKDGGTWTFHPDIQTFDPVANFINPTTIYAMDATGTGLVVAVGNFFGESEDQTLALSRDFGETWELMPSDIYPFSDLSSALLSVVIKDDFEWIISDGDNVWYTYDGGGHWVEVVLPTGWSITNARFFNDYWWFYGMGYTSDQWCTPLIRSKDLSVWEPVVTPWSGTYPPYEAYLDRPHEAGDCGIIDFLAYDPLTNTVIAIGFFGGTYGTDLKNGYVLFSRDGGENWIEIGFKSRDHLRDDYEWDGVFNWPNTWRFQSGSAAYAFGWWFCAMQEPVPPPVTITYTFNYTGAEQVFVVPEEIISLTMQVEGAQDGGTLGTKVACDLPVVPGREIYLFVGGSAGWNGKDSDVRVDGDAPENVIIIAGGGAHPSEGTDINQTISTGVRSGDGRILVTWTVPAGISPPLIRISPDGRITEAVYPSLEQIMMGNLLVSGGDLTN